MSPFALKICQLLPSCGHLAKMHLNKSAGRCLLITGTRYCSLFNNTEQHNHNIDHLIIFKASVIIIKYTDFESQYCNVVTDTSTSLLVSSKQQNKFFSVLVSYCSGSYIIKTPAHKYQALQSLRSDSNII